jgi:Cu+-exporting ATPase
MSDTKTFSKDPICKFAVDEATSVHSDRDGKTYYFCSELCQKKFLAVSAGEAKTCSESILRISNAGPVGNPIPGQASAGASVPVQASRA